MSAFSLSQSNNYLPQTASIFLRFIAPDSFSTYLYRRCYTITTRLYRTDAPLVSPTYENLVTQKSQNATDTAEPGYEFVGNWNTDATHNDIHLKETSPKTYAVRVRFRNNDISKLTGINAEDMRGQFCHPERSEAESKSLP